MYESYLESSLSVILGNWKTKEAGKLMKLDTAKAILCT